MLSRAVGPHRLGRGLWVGNWRDGAGWARRADAQRVGDNHLSPCRLRATAQPCGRLRVEGSTGLWGLGPDRVVPGTAPPKAWVSNTGPFCTNIWLHKPWSLPQVILNRERPSELGFGHIHWRVSLPCPPVGLPGLRSHLVSGLEAGQGLAPPRARGPRRCAPGALSLGPGLSPRAHWAPAGPRSPMRRACALGGCGKPAGPGAGLGFPTVRLLERGAAPLP